MELFNEGFMWRIEGWKKGIFESDCEYVVDAELMWEPVLQDKHQEHVKFCKYANQLVEQVSGKPQFTTNIDPSINRIRRVSSYTSSLVC